MRPSPLAQLAALCQAHPLSPKVVFVPNPQAGQNLAAALAASGQTGTELRLITAAGWAEALAGPQLQAEGWSPISQDADLFLVWELLATGGHLRALGGTGRPGLVRPLLQVLRALRLAGVDPEVGTCAHQGLAALYRDYAARLEERRCYDQATLFARAAHCQGNLADAVYAILDETLLPEMALRFVQALAGPRLYRIGQDECPVPLPAHSAAALFPQAPFPLPKESCNTHPAEVLARTTIGAEAEVREVLRDLLREHIPLDQVELVYTAESPYLGLIYGVAERLGLPVDAALGFPAYLSRPGQALAGFYRWISTGFERAELADLCRAGLIRRSPGKGEVHLLARYLFRADNPLEQREHDGVLPGEENLVLCARELGARLRALVPYRPRVSVRDLAVAGVEFLREFAPIRREHDREALDSLVERLQKLSGVVGGEDTAPRLALRLLELLAQHQAGASAARPGHLFAAPLDTAGYSGRKYLYMLGMDENAFPGKSGEDPFLSDGERSRLGLPLQRSRPDEQVWQVWRLFSMPGYRIVLLARRCSLADGRETTPSALFQQVAEHQGNSGFSPLLPPPELALDEVEALLASRRAPGFEGRMEVLFPWLTRGETCLRLRQGPELTRFDGWLGQETPELEIADGQALLSASRLEALVRCPYSYFLRYVLGIEPTEKPAEEPGRWLSPAQFGSLLHTLFRCFMETLKKRGERPDQRKHAFLLEEMLRDLSSEYREHIPVVREAAYRADLKRAERAARIFLKIESQRQHLEPVGFEMSFGSGEKEGDRQGAPVVLTLAEKVRIQLQGRIDRIDRQGDAYQLWDYKTGSSALYEEGDLLRGGHLQWALYAHALGQILRQQGQKGEVAESGYFFVGAQEHGRRLSAKPPAPALLAERLAPLLEMARKGCFFHIQKERQCAHCDYASLCAGEQRLPGDLDPETAIPDQPEISVLLRRWMDA